MNQFAFAGANVTTPTGDTYVDIPCCTRGNTLVYNLDGLEHRVEMSAGWAQGQRGYGFADMNGGEWLVKRTGGCGC